MPFDLKNLNPPFRCDWNDEEWVELRRVAPAQQKELFRRLGVKFKVEHKVNPQTRRLERIDYLDIPRDMNDEYEESMIDLQIHAWNLRTPDDDPIPCTKANKVLLMRGEPAFSDWVAKQLRTDTELEIETVEEEIKN